jgi:hypothetical protein
VLTQNAQSTDLSRIKMIRRVKQGEILRIASPAASKRPLTRVHAICLADDKSGFVTLANGQQIFLKCKAVKPPPSEEGKNGDKVKPPPTIIGQVRATLGEAVQVVQKGDGSLKPAFLVKRLDGAKVEIAWEEDEALAIVDVATVRCR